MELVACEEALRYRASCTDLLALVSRAAAATPAPPPPPPGPILINGGHRPINDMTLLNASE